MSTRAVIARKTTRGWSGRYYQDNGEPTHLGRELWILQEEWDGDVKAMLSMLIDQHPAGWSEIVGVDWCYTPGYTEDRDELQKMGRKRWGRFQERANRPQCFCHGDRHEEGFSITKSQDRGDIEWAYVVDEAARTMKVLYGVNGKPQWFECGTVSFDGPEPDLKDWKVLRYLPCKVNPKWCHHHRWVHDETICRTCDGTRINASSGHAVGLSLQQDHSDCVAVEDLSEPVRSIYFKLPNVPKSNWHCYSPRMCEACGGTGKAQTVQAG